MNNAKQKKFFQKLVEKHLKRFNTKDDRQLVYKQKELIRLMSAVKNIFMKESSLVEINPPCVVVGDIHGQFVDLLNIFDSFSDEHQSGVFKHKFVFLGDYVDRGLRSLECVTLLSALKVLYPDRFMLLRGNHECSQINMLYGFKEELQERFNGNDADLLFRTWNDVFSYMPLAGLIGKKILCMHGGISKLLKSIDDIKKIPKPLPDPTAYELAMDLLWADPGIGLSGFLPNDVRGVSVFFGKDAVMDVCQNLNVDMIVRGHQMMFNGYNFFADRRCVTVFSAPRYFAERPNKGAVMVITAEGKCSFKLFFPAEVDCRGQQVINEDLEQNNLDDDEIYEWIRPTQSRSTTTAALKLSQTSLKTCVGSERSNKSNKQKPDQKSNKGTSTKQKTDQKVTNAVTGSKKGNESTRKKNTARGH